MSLKWISLCGCFFAVGLASLLSGNWQSGQRLPAIIKQQAQGLQFEFINNSPTVSQALGINAAGSMIGLKENESTFQQVYFYFGKDNYQQMPVPKGFTNVEATALSDTELVVGRTTKAIGSEGSLRAVLWSPGKSEIKLLPLPPGDGQSDALDISADGKRITGYATGPQRLRPVVWEWNESQTTWQIEVLPTAHEYNPYLMSSQLIVSPDGNIIVGCCTEKLSASGMIDSSLYEWRLVDHKWTQRLVTEEQMYIKAINNKGDIAGSVSAERGRLPCVITSEGKLKLLDLLAGDVAGEARDINDASVIVGWSDDPPGKDGGPTPCTWNLEGKATQVKVGESGFGTLFAINQKGQMAGAADVITKAATSATANDEQGAMLAVRISKE